VPRRRLLAAAALAVVLAAAAVAVADPFAGSAAPTRDGVTDNAAPTALARVERRTLTSQTQVSGTLGYSGSWTVAVPAGTDETVLRQADQQLVAARAAVASAQAAASADVQAVAQANAALRAAQLKEAADCAGGNAAAGTATTPGSGSSGGSPCANAMQTVSADETAATAARQKVAADEAQLASARATLASARQSLADARTGATPYGGSASYTMLPPPGKVVRRGQSLYAIDGQPTLLLYGGTPAWRVFAPGMSPGRDVAELNANLAALGYGGVAGDAFTGATERAVVALQRARGLASTGTLALGAVAFEPGAVRVTAVTPTVGQAVQPGPLMTVSSTRHAVAVQLDASQQSQVAVGDRVTVTLPDNSLTPGVVSSVGKVATTPSSDPNANNGDSSNPTIEVDVRLLHASAAGTLDQAPVQVSITTDSVSNSLVVPVNALVALAGGGYAVEQVEPAGTHRLVAVTPGLFDDTQGLVQVSGDGLAAGQRVVVPAS
jgi:putative peptidoglycan binding protein